MPPAASSSVPGRPSGLAVNARPRIASGMPCVISWPATSMVSPSSFGRVIRVSMNPKATALQRTPNRPHSFATVFVSPTMPIFAVA